MKIVSYILSNLSSIAMLYVSTVIVLKYYSINDIGINNAANSGFAFFIILPILLIADFVLYKFTLFFIKYIKKNNREVKTSTKILIRFGLSILISCIYIIFSIVSNPIPYLE